MALILNLGSVNINKSVVGYSLGCITSMCSLCCRRVLVKYSCRSPAGSHPTIWRGYYSCRLRLCSRTIRVCTWTAEILKGVSKWLSWRKTRWWRCLVFFVAFQNEHLSHSFRHDHFDQHCSSILASLTTAVLEDIEVLGLYDAIRLVGYDLLFRLLELQSSQQVDWSRYGDTYPSFFW